MAAEDPRSNLPSEDRILPAPKSVIAKITRGLSFVPPLIWLLLLVAACLVPFARKAFNMDDTLFLRAAEQIQKHPADFYGFDINWYGTPMPMSRITENPPLTCYYLALAGTVFGWSETAMHLAFLLPALAAAWGTFSLARRFCSRPLVAGVVAVVTPVFLVSANTVMCDVMLLAFWVWSMALFELGLGTGDWRDFFGSGLLASLACLTKFTGLGLVLLLGAYGLIHWRRAARWSIALILPLLIVAAYELATRHLYGKGLLSGAIHFSAAGRTASEGNLGQRIVLGLGFLGGCFLPVLLYTPWLWSRRSVSVWLCLFVFCTLMLPAMAPLARCVWREDQSLDWMVLLQSVLFTVAGAQILVLALADGWKRRDASSVLLLLWFSGIFVFAIAVNWTLNARSLLPLAPAVGILLARRLDQRPEKATPAKSWRFILPTAGAVALSVCLVRADCELANANRGAATVLCARYRKPGRTIWFEGHWGFQYYMEKFGASALDTRSPRLSAQDIVVLPSNASNVHPLPVGLLQPVEVLESGTTSHWAVMNQSAGAGFYGAILGPLPFLAGRIEPERFSVFTVTHDSPP